MASERRISRRRLLGLGHLPPERPDARRLVFNRREGPAGDVLVCVFLRGGADGLHLVAPTGDDHYYRRRPRIAVPRPDDRKAEPPQRGIPLDPFFALNPGIAPLQEAFHAGHLAVVHAVGSPDRTHSHFEAMATMERGVDDASTMATGWLGRHLERMPSPSRSPLRALAIGDTLPASLEGALGATAVHSLDAFRLALPARWSPDFRAALAGLYPVEAGLPPGPTAQQKPGSRSLNDESEAALRSAGRETLELLRALERLQPDRYRSDAGSRYPESDFGRGLAQIAQLVKAEVGLEVACLDLGGWDTHFGQGPILDGLMADLAGGLAAFHRDLGERLDRVTLVVMSEFGRRVHENGALGTDHGEATCFFLLGGGIHGGRVLADWPGLDEDRLEGPGDLRATIDYRDLLAEVVARRLKNPAWREVFPGHAARFRGVCA